MLPAKLKSLGVYTIISQRLIRMIRHLKHEHADREAQSKLDLSLVVHDENGTSVWHAQLVHHDTSAELATTRRSFDNVSAATVVAGPRPTATHCFGAILG